MKYIIDTNQKEPAYFQLYNQIKNDIIAGVYPYNTKLPSKRTISSELNISLVTVEHAYSLLCDEGYIEARERSGYFVIFKVEDGFANPINNFIPILPAPINLTNEEFPISVLTKTMRSVINNYNENILTPSANFGTIELRNAIKQYLARSRGINAEIDQIIIGSGSEYLYSTLVNFFGNNNIFAIEYPSYKKIEQVYKLCGAKYEMLPLGKDGIESSYLWHSKGNILHISPYRSFPTGISATASKRHEYLNWAKKNRYIIEDDFESEFSISRKPEESLFSLSKDDNVIYMNTFSQTISSSLRVGYMIIPKHLVNDFNEKLGFCSCTVPTFIQYVIAELINNGDFERHINRIRRKKRKKLAK